MSSIYQSIKYESKQKIFIIIYTKIAKLWYHNREQQWPVVYSDGFQSHNFFFSNCLNLKRYVEKIFSHILVCTYREVSHLIHKIIRFWVNVFHKNKDKFMMVANPS